MTQDQPTSERKGLALALLALAQFVVVLDASIVNVALPSIGRDLHFAPDDLYNEATASYVYTPSRRYNVYFSASNQLSDSSSVLLEALYMDRNSDRQLSPVPFIAHAEMVR